MDSFNSTQPLVSIISVNYNGLNDTREFLLSIDKISYSNIEIILIDNGSDENIDQISLEFPKIRLIKNDRNLGFAGANNVGIKHSNGNYILAINNDVIVTPNFLEPLVRKLEQNKNTGIVSPKIYYYSNPKMLQYAGFTDINPITIRNKGIGFNEIDEGKYDIEKTTFYAHGAAFLFPKKLINEIGYLSEKFFLYYEEMDWCKQVRNKGYQIFYIPQSIVYHKDSATTGTNSPLKTYYLNRGRLIYMLRNVKYPHLIISTLYQLLFAFPKNIFLLILKRKWAHAGAYCKAFAWFLLNFFNQKIRGN